jgi:MFS family permease
MNRAFEARPWRALALLSLAELLVMSVWFTASSVAPELQERWTLSASEVGWLTTSVQLGFVMGTAVAALLNLADILPSRAYFAGAALLAAGANALLLAATGLPVALVSRFLTGFMLAGVYPPAMKMIATWFRRNRGLAIGTVVGALTVGKAMPYLLKTLPEMGLKGVTLGASGAAVVGSILVFLWYRDGPHSFLRMPFSWGLIGRVVRHRETRLAVAGYLGHMWELYAMWTWVPAFLVAGVQARAGVGVGASSTTMADLVAFGAIAAGGAGCVWGGWAADRIGRERLVNLAMAVSGGCSLMVGFFFGWSLWVVAPIVWVWGFFVVADSAQFSALVTEVAPPEAVGTALTLQTSLGFLLTMLTIQAVPLASGSLGWQWGFTLLALGPAFGIGAILRLGRIRRESLEGAGPG